jgi:hypothetical protein
MTNSNQGTIFLIKGIFCIIITRIRETKNNKAVTSGTDIIGLRKDGDNKNTPNNHDVYNAIGLEERGIFPWKLRQQHL